MGGGRERERRKAFTPLFLFLLFYFFSLISKFTPPSNVCRTHGTGYAPHILLNFILTCLPRQD